MNKLYKYAYATETNWKEKAERKIYAQMLRYVIVSRGRTTALKYINNEWVQIELSTLTDDDIMPEKGFYLMGHCPPVSGMLQNDEGLTTKALTFKTDKTGQEWAVLKCRWSCPACIPCTVLTAEQATALNAEVMEIPNHPDHYMVPELPIDMIDVINSYTWDVITETEPDWEIIEEGM